jgi:hypothetical protein
MKQLILIAAVATLSGCSTIANLLPRDHDPVMFNTLVVLNIEIQQVDCAAPDWSSAVLHAEILSQSANWRSDPQAENFVGLHQHMLKLEKGGSVTFCELGKRTAASRIDAARAAWGGR